MTMQVTDSPFYRVSVKALIFDTQDRLLVFQDNKGAWEMPGGGWEHGETLQECITRELYEEMRIVPKAVGSIKFVYTGKHEKNFYKMFITVPVTIDESPFVPTDDNLEAAQFVSKQEFMELPFGPNEIAVRACADQIWSES